MTPEQVATEHRWCGSAYVEMGRTALCNREPGHDGRHRAVHPWMRISARYRPTVEWDDEPEGD